MYKTKEEAENRLYNTTFLYKNQVVRCVAVTGGADKIALTLSNIPYDERKTQGEQQIKVSLDDPGLNVRDFNIGYANDGGRAHYVVRMPQRHRQQGLTYQSLLMPQSYVRDRYTAAHFIQSRAFSEMLTGQYPSVREAYSALLKGKAKSVAYSRHWALEKDDLDMIVIRYKGRKVAASIALDSLEFRLPEKFRQLKELLGEQKDIKIA